MDVVGVTAIARLAQLDPSNIMLLEWAEAQTLVLAVIKRNLLTRPTLVRAYNESSYHHDGGGGGDHVLREQQ